MKLTIFSIFKLLSFIYLISIISSYNLKNSAPQPSISNEPKFSVSSPIILEDPNSKLSLSTFLQKFKYSLYHLSKGEAISLFNFADKKHQDLLSPGEWNELSNIFITPFEQCDQDKDYLLSNEELKQCFQNEPTSKYIQVKPHQKEKMFDTLREYLNFSHNEKGINLYSYILLRKAMYAWTKCHSDSNFMLQDSFKCAITLIGPYQYIHQTEIAKIYKYSIEHLSNDLGSVQLDFLTLVKASFYLNAFSLFGASRDTFILEKDTFIKTALKEDILPNNFDEQEINSIFSMISHNMNNSKKAYMTFETFAFFYNINRLFNIYSKERPSLISIKEATESLKHSLAPITTVLSIDKSYTNFEEKEYQNVTMLDINTRKNEDTFYSFKQDGTEKTGAFDKKGDVYKIQPNEKNRIQFFEIFSGQTYGYLTKEEFYIAFASGEIFTFYLKKGIWTISMKTLKTNLEKDYDIIIPNVGYKNRYGLMIYQQIPDDFDIDILVFSVVEAFQYKVDIEKEIDETTVKRILSDFGMSKMPKSIYVNSMRGVDTIKRQMYKPSEFIRAICIAQAICSAQKRNEEFTKMNNKQ